MNDCIDSIRALEAVIGKTPPPVKLKVIDHLDEHALRWIAASSLAFASFCDASSVNLTLGGGEPGFVTARRTLLQLPLAALDHPTLARAGQSFGSLFLISGLRETLRVNGRLHDAVARWNTVVRGPSGQSPRRQLPQYSHPPRDRRRAAHPRL